MEPGGAGYEALALPSELFKWILIALYIDVTKLLTSPPTCVTSLANTVGARIRNIRIPNTFENRTF